MLTDAQKVDVRRWLGYPTLNSGEADYVFGHMPSSISLNDKLDALTASEEDALTTRYLTPLETLEAAILSAADNLDTKIAGPWTANERELSQRTSLYNKWRRDMAAYLGFAPGPALGDGGITLVRC